MVARAGNIVLPSSSKVFRNGRTIPMISERDGPGFARPSAAIEGVVQLIVLADMIAY